jgi:hypothetical protein
MPDCQAEIQFSGLERRSDMRICFDQPVNLGTDLPEEPVEEKADRSTADQAEDDPPEGHVHNVSLLLGSQNPHDRVEIE